MENHEADNWKMNWQAKRSELLEENPSLNKKDLQREFENEEELLVFLQDKLKKTKKDIRNWLHFLG